VVGLATARLEVEQVGDELLEVAAGSQPLHVLALAAHPLYFFRLLQLLEALPAVVDLPSTGNLRHFQLLYFADDAAVRPSKGRAFLGQFHVVGLRAAALICLKSCKRFHRPE
jgi:hypothetical protein